MTRPVPAGVLPRENRRREQVVVFTIGACGFVISAASVQEIRSTDSLGGAVMDLDRSSLRKVRHIVERDSRSCFVVSGCAHFHLPVTRPTSVLILRDVPVAVLVDRIEEMSEMRVILPLPLSFCGDERIWYRGLTVLGRKVLPVADPRGFLTEVELRQLAEQHQVLVHAAEADARERQA
jgi:chemotaxis signal transduction protein